MDIKNMFNKRDSLTEELKMLPRETKKRILDNVNRRRNEILEEKILEKQLKGLSTEKQTDKRTMKKFREGMHGRRKELIEKGIIKPPIRYNKENFTSPLEEMSRKARAAEIKGFEDQRNKLKSGSMLEIQPKIKLKDLELKIPKGSGILLKEGKFGKQNDGII